MNHLARAADVLVSGLIEHGTSHVFGVGGANIEDVYDAAAAHPELTAVLAKHEFSAAAMADGYSRATGRLGVVMATSGGGALNLVPGLGESLSSRVPVLALVGQAPASLDGRGSFQDTSGCGGALDAEALFSSVSVFCRRVRVADQLVEALSAAITAAHRGGPAVLLLPKDIQQSLVSVEGGSRLTAVSDRPDSDDVSPILRAVRSATGPVTIIAGEQVARDDARAELEQLRSMLGARVATVPDAKDVSGAAIGVTGVMGHPGVATVVAGSGLCLLVGTRLSMTARAGLDHTLTLVPTISIGSARPYCAAQHVHADDLRKSLLELRIELADQRPISTAWSAAPSIPDELIPPAHLGPGVRYRDAMRVIDRTVPDDADIVVDAGNTGAAAIHYLPARRDGRFLVALGMGGMGYSFGASVGMAFGRRRRTVVIAGDGAFFMHGMEVHTAIQYRLPITFVLLNNNAHAMCVTREQLFYGGRYSYNRFHPSSIGHGLAAMFPGLPAADVTSAAEMAAALTDALKADGPSVVVVECSAEEIPPFAPFLIAAQHDSIPKENHSDVTAGT